MAGLNIQTDHTGRFVQEAALVPTDCHPLSGSSNPPKFGTLIPNRIFVGGIPSNTTEQELKTFFSSFGQVKDVKIINDRLGVSKGSYGFVTFESQEMAEKIIQNESETLIFKDRKLNIGHAIRKQQIFPRSDLPATLFFAGGAVPYGFQNGMAMFPLSAQEYPMLTQATASYTTMMVPQPGGGTAALYLPQSLHSAAAAAAAAAASPYAQLSQQQLTAALQQQQQQQQQQFQQQAAANPALASALGGALTPASCTVSNSQSNSTAAVMAAAAAMAAAVQWPQQASQGSGQQQNSQQQQQQQQQAPQQQQQAQAQQQQQPQQQLAGQVASAALTQNAALTPQQAAAMAAAVAAQQQSAWRWSPSMQQPSSASHLAAQNMSTTAVNTTLGSSTSLVHGQGHQQNSPTTNLGPPAYLYSPIAGTGHELMFFHQTSSPYAANSTSDYSTDHSAHNSSMLESIEQISFPCDATPLGRHSQQIAGAFGGQQLEGACLPQYAAFTPFLDLQSHTSCTGQPNTLISPTLHQLRQPHHASATAVLAAAAAAAAAPSNLVSLASQPAAQAKIYSPVALSGAANQGATAAGQLPYNNSVNVTSHTELGPSSDLTAGGGGDKTGSVLQVPPVSASSSNVENSAGANAGGHR